MSSRARLLVALILLEMTQAGCAALRNEWSGKHGGPDVDSEVRTAVEQALPLSTDVSVSSHKNGFSQEMNVAVTLANPSFDADALIATARAICEAVELTDVVYLEVTDGSADTHLDLAALVTAHLPDLNTPYDPTQVQIEVDGDCTGF